MKAADEELATAGGFWESRTGWSRLKRALLLEPLPGGSRWAAAFGSLLLFTFLLQAITGILLAMSYAPAVKTAWPSVKFIQEELPLGWFIRAVHHWGASAMIILLLLHLIQVYVWGAYKRPRELTWMVGVLLLVCTIGLAFTGYLLPWDEKAYWATRVGLGITSTVPVVGDWLRAMLQGGTDLGNLTLTRFFTLHVFVLPIALCLLSVVHLYLFRLHGVTPPFWISKEQQKATEEPFWPGQAWKDAVVAMALLLGLGIWCHFWMAPLGAQANPGQPYEARPEWYFMFLFRLLRYFEGPWEVVGTFILPTAWFLALLFWPFLDRSRQLDPRRRPVAIALLVLATAGLLGSTIHAIVTDVRLPEPAMAQNLEPKTPPPAGPIQRLQIAAIYRDNCVACHGDDGSGSSVRAAMPSIPDFRNMAWQLAKTDLEIVHQIQDGKVPMMPAFRNKISQEEILGLAIYLRAFAVGPAGEAQQKAVTATPTPEIPPKSPSSSEAQPPKSSNEKPLRAVPQPIGQVEKPAPVATPQPAETPSHQPPIAPVAGPQLFGDYCLACHGADGRGTAMRAAMPEIPDFTAAKWQKSRSDTDLKHSILEGKGKFMLSMKSKVSPVGADELVTYVRKFAEGKPAASGKASSPPSTATIEKSPKAEVHAPAPKAEKPREETPKPVVNAEPPAAQQKETPPAKGPEISPDLPLSPTTERVHVSATLYRQYCLTCHGLDGHGTDMRAAMPPIPDFANNAWQRSHNNAQLAASITNGKNVLMPAFGDRLKASEIRDLVAYIRAFGPASPAASAASGPADFEKQYRELQRQWTELEHQLQAISPESGKR